MRMSLDIGVRIFAGMVCCTLLAPMSFADTIATPSARLPEMVHSTWHRGPDLPMGFQESAGGIVDGALITSTGFSRGYLDDVVPGKKNKSPREKHLKETWGLKLADSGAGWTALPDFPGTGRTAAFGIAVDQKLYLWGGCEWNNPYTFKDGYRLSRVNDQWQWDKLPDLPLPMGSSGIAAIGSKIYVMGGSQYFLRGGGTYLTNLIENGSPFGSHLMVFDTADSNPAWKALPPCPGTPRCVQAMAAVGGKIYVLGGAAGENNPSGVTCTVVDNWQFDPQTSQWRRLPDLPVASGSFPSGRIAFHDRYILLIGGYQYSAILDPDGKTRPPYGTPSKNDPQKDYFSDIFVYDTQTQKFGTATPLPMNIHLPMSVVEGNQLHLIGGETDGFTLDGEQYGHNPDLYLIGELKASAK